MLSQAAASSTILHSSHGSMSQPTIEQLHRDATWEQDDAVRTTAPLASLDASLNTSLAGTPRHLQLHQHLQQPLSHSRAAATATTSKGSFSLLQSSPYPSPSSAQCRIIAEDETATGAPHDKQRTAASEEKEESPATTEQQQQQQHYRGRSDSAVIRSSPAIVTAAIARRMTADNASIIRAVRQALQSPRPPPLPPRAILQQEAPLSTKATAAESSMTTATPTSSPLSAPPLSERAISDAVSGLGSSSSAPTQPPSVHLTSINLRLHATQSDAASPCPSPLDLTSATASAAADATPPLTPPLTPLSKPDILHQLDDVTVYRAIAAYHREHRDEGLGPSWFNANALLIASCERERDHARRRERVIRITEYRKGRLHTSSRSRPWDSAALLTDRDEMDGLMRNPRTIVHFLHGLQTAH